MGAADWLYLVDAEKTLTRGFVGLLFSSELFHQKFNEFILMLVKEKKSPALYKDMKHGAWFFFTAEQ